MNSSIRCWVWYGTNDLHFEERPMPPLGPTDVLVEVAGCGVCATDLHILDGSIALYQPPKVLGHEVGGVVRSVGADVRHVRPGDAVALDTTVSCQACFFCREGQPFMCPDRTSTAAGFADFQLVPGSVVYKLPPGLEPELGALAEPLSCAMHAVDRAGLRPADSVAIVGAGAVGLLVLQVARLSGATTIIVSEPDPGRRALAGRLGATCTVDPTSTDPLDAVRAETAGRGVDCAFEAVGSVRTIEQAFGLPRQGGTLIQVSVPPVTARLDLPAYELFARELTIRGSFIRTTEFRRAVELLGVLDLRPLITERFALSQAPAAIEAARQRQGVRVLVGGSQ